MQTDADCYFNVKIKYHAWALMKRGGLRKTPSELRKTPGSLNFLGPPCSTFPKERTLLKEATASSLEGASRRPTLSFWTPGWPTCWVALLVEGYLSDAASFVLCVFCRVKDHHKLLHYSSLLKKTCVKQVVLDKWLPLTPGSPFPARSERVMQRG